MYFIYGQFDLQETAISGIETLRQLGLLGKANFKAAKSLTAWE